MKFKMCRAFLLVLLLTGLRNAQKLEASVMGGTDCDIKKHPYFVYVRTSKAHGLGTSCGGTIISRRYVLTAAHCVYKKDESFILTEPSRMRGHPFFDFKKHIYVKRMIVHYKFNSKNLKYDLALLELNEDVPKDRSVQLITAKLMKELIYRNNTLTETMGYGTNTIYSDEHKFHRHKSFQCLQTVIIKRRNCSLDMIPSVMLCSMSTDTQGALEGDSGGPLMYRGKLAGVVSFGKFLESQAYTVYARVDIASGWIAEYVDHEKLGFSKRFSSRSSKEFCSTNIFIYIFVYILLLYMYIKG